MAVSVEDIKKLKELTGVGLTDAKQALVAAEGDFDKALEAMRKKGLTKAEKKGDRETREGIIDSYVHSDRIGVVVLAIAGGVAVQLVLAHLHIPKGQVAAIEPSATRNSCARPPHRSTIFAR